MSGFHIATPGAALLFVAFRPRTALAPRQSHYAGSTIPEFAGQSSRLGQAVPLREIADTQRRASAPGAPSIGAMVSVPKTPELIKKGLSAKRESRRIEFKEGFDPQSARDWCEIVKDIVAIANSGGGLILFGLDSHGTPSNRMVDEIARVDPAQITDKVSKYTEPTDLEFEVCEVEKDGQRLVAFIIGGVPSPLVFKRPGTFDAGGGKQRSAFSVGAVYFRHGAKSEPGSTADVRQAVERGIELARRSWIRGVRKIAQAPRGSEVLIASPTGRPSARSKSSAQALRVVNDPGGQQVFLTRDPSKAAATMVHEEISDGIFDEINNVIDANRGLAKGRRAFFFDQSVYYRIYSEREHVRQEDESLSLLLHGAIAEFYAPGLYWMLKLPGESTAQIFANAMLRPRHPQVHHVLRIAVLLGDSFCNWLSKKWDSKWRRHSQPPPFYWSFKESVEKSRVAGPLVSASRIAPAAEILVPGEPLVAGKELLENPRAAAELLSKACASVFEDRAATLRSTARGLDYLAYGADIVSRSAGISAAIIDAVGGRSVEDAV